MADVAIDPVCAFHGLRASEHPEGRCLFCCLCFDVLTPAECWRDAQGIAWDVCRACGEAEPLGGA